MKSISVSLMAHFSTVGVAQFCIVGNNSYRVRLYLGDKQGFLRFTYFYVGIRVFDAQLPKVIFTVQRQKGMLGYFAPERWSSVEGEHCHEIAINPAHLGQCRIIEVLQTLAHETAHCWQFCYGNPGRGVTIIKDGRIRYSISACNQLQQGFQGETL